MQEILPLIPAGASQISENLSVVCQDDRWTYFHGCFPVYSHQAEEKCSFRMISSSFICEGVCRNIDIQMAFNVSKRSVIRSVTKYKTHGSGAFFKEIKKKKRSSKKLTPEKIKEAEELLSCSFTRTETAAKLTIGYSALCKAISAGRVIPRNTSDDKVSDKSQRSQRDNDESVVLGVACGRVEERTLAAFGIINSVESRFERCNDVSFGGVLTALAALETNGLYSKLSECFAQFKGYYSVVQVITLLGFMALCRIKTVENLRWQPPGELGKLLGLDRVPEVRCLREKLDSLSADGAAEKWGEVLSKKWMNDNIELSGVLYVDGHVRLYAGNEKLPKQYVSRERLCMRGVMDFWVNDMLGQPLFVIRTDVNPGMLEVLRKEIIPRLLKEVPNQPSEEMLSENQLLHRFIIVFDREGYSPEFFKEMWEKYRIACITYRKYPKEDWKESEFKKTKITLVNGEETSMLLAERGSFIGDRKQGLWVREIRKLTESKHQTSIVSTAFALPNMLIAALMFARWCQENFFNYMMKHYAIDLLNEYGKKDIPDTGKVVSPEYRRQEKEINSLVGKLKSLKSRFADFTLHPVMETDSSKYKKWEKSKTDMAEEITLIEAKLPVLKEKQKHNPKHIQFAQLPESERFKALSSSRKNLTDAVKMVAYRAETAMANIIAGECGTLEQARALLRDVFLSEADLIPDNNSKTLTVRLHNLSSRTHDKILDQLLSVLNEAEMKFPGTNMTLRYARIGSS